MKIAIQGHSTRGKEIIQILESLGGKNKEGLNGSKEYWYFINSDGYIRNDYKSVLQYKGFKTYTLEEFEKEFPFKIGDEVMFPVKTGWASGKVTGLAYIEDQLKYEVNVRISGYHYVESHKLQLYQMKEERNVTLTLEKAKEWYKKGGELKEIALQAFTEKELTKVDLPKTWEEFCRTHKIMPTEAIIKGSDSSICFFRVCGIRHAQDDRNMCPSGASAEAHLAMIQLEQLRNCWWNGWEPNWLDANVIKYTIKGWRDKHSIETTYVSHAFLSFPTYKLAHEFLECFRDLIEKAGDLI